MSVATYLELLDWTARELRGDKRGATPESAAPIFERLGIDADVWCELTRDFASCSLRWRASRKRSSQLAVETAISITRDAIERKSC